jgi:hypothetical protein
MFRIFYNYAQLLQQDLREKWDAVNVAHNACYEGDDFHITNDQSKIDSFTELLNQLDNTCKALAEKRDKEKELKPQIPYYLQKQVLTDEDHEFISEKKLLLSSVEPEVGKLDFYAETGTEGAYWSVEVDGLSGYDALRIIREGDRLVIYNVHGVIIFDEIIIEDTKSGWRPYPHNSPYGLGQQVCVGLLVHWIPKGWSSQEWGEFFKLNRNNGKVELYQLPKIHTDSEETTEHRKA